MLDFEILTSETQLETIADEWRDLHMRTGNSPFADYDLFCIWWRTVGKTSGDRSLHVVTARDARKLVGLLPLSVIRRKGLRIMQAAGYKGYNYCDMLAETKEQALALWQAARKSPHYHFATIRDVYPDTLAYDTLSTFACKRDLSPALYLRNEWADSEAWMASLPKKARHEFNRHMRRLEEKGTVSFQVYENGPLPMDLIDLMIKHKINWVNDREKEGVFEHPNVYVYFRELVETLAKQNRLLFCWLKCGDEPIAFLLALVWKQEAHGYVLTYDPAWAVSSPGILVMVELLRWSIDHDLKGFDHRQGDTHYKARYSNVSRTCGEFTFSGSAIGLLAEHTFMGLRTLARKLKIRTF